MSTRLAISYLFLLSLGPLGAHRFYLGRYFSGVIYMLTAGLCGIGVVADFFILPFIADAVPPQTGDVFDFLFKFFMTLASIAAVGFFACAFIFLIVAII